MKLDDVKEANLPPEDRKSREELSQFYRNEELKHHLHTIVKIGLYTAFLAFLSVFLVRIVHLIIPQCYHWLDKDQVQNIDKIFFSGAIGGIIGGYLKDKVQKY